MYEVDGQAVRLACSNGALHLEVMAADLIRFRLLPPDSDERADSHESVAPFSYALDPAVEWPPVAITVEESAESLTIGTGEMICRVDRSPC